MKYNLAKQAQTTQLDSAEIVERVISACMDAKGRDIVILDVAEVFGLADNFIVVSGRSDRQSQGIANKVIDHLAREGVKPTSIQGFEEGHWIVVDYDDVVVHVFYEPARMHYNIESLWAKAGRHTVDSKSGQ